MKSVLSLEESLSEFGSSIARTHLNVCAIESSLGRYSWVNRARHKAALDHARKALDIGMREYKKLKDENDSSAETIVPTLAIGFYNLAVELEHLNSFKEAYIECRNGLSLCMRKLGEKHSLTKKLKKLMSTMLKSERASRPNVEGKSSSKRAKSVLRTPSSYNSPLSKKTVFPHIKFTPKKPHMNCLGLELIEEEKAGSNLTVDTVHHGNPEADAFKLESTCKLEPVKMGRRLSNTRLASQGKLAQRRNKNAGLKSEDRKEHQKCKTEAKIKLQASCITSPYAANPTVHIRGLNNVRIKLLPCLQKKRQSDVPKSRELLTLPDYNETLYGGFNVNAKSRELTCDPKEPISFPVMNKDEDSKEVQYKVYPSKQLGQILRSARKITRFIRSYLFRKAINGRIAGKLTRPPTADFPTPSL